MSTNTAPKPSTDTPLYPAGDLRADVNGFLYESTGAAVIIDGNHASVESTNAEADYWATHEWT